MYVVAFLSSDDVTTLYR